MPIVAVALGSNLGDRHAHLDWAVQALGQHLSHLRASRYIETEPVGVPDPQPPYLNAAVVGETSVSAEALLMALLDLEAARGRERTSFRSARTLDLDLLLYADAVMSQPELTVPHPRFRERRFVLEPLAEIAPDLRDPVTGLTVADLLARLRTF